jgi:hypothetical protein
MNNLKVNSDKICHYLQVKMSCQHLNFYDAKYELTCPVAMFT